MVFMYIEKYVIQHKIKYSYFFMDDLLPVLALIYRQIIF